MSHFNRNLNPSRYICILRCSTVYMSSSFWLLDVASRDFSHAEKERTACKADQIYKMTTIFTQNGHRLSFWVNIVVILWIFSALKKITWLNSQQPKTRGHVGHLLKSTITKATFRCWTIWLNVSHTSNKGFWKIIVSSLQNIPFIMFVQILN